MVWQGPFGDGPAEVLPGPNNPWLACGGGGSGGRPAPGAGKPELPDLQIPDQGSVSVDWKKIGVGTTMMVGGVLIVVVTIIVAIAIGASLPATGTGIAIGIVVGIIGSVIAAGGSALAGAGGATVLGGIDPKVIDYKKHVAPLPRRSLSLPHGLPPSVVNFMMAIVEIELLSTAETDIIDYARAAAQANDKKWTDLHLRDLYYVQSGKQHFMDEMVASLREITQAFGKDFDNHKVDPTEPLRDMINPIIEMRSTMKEVADISSTEINALLQQIRVPSPMATSLENSVQALAKSAGGQPSKMLDLAADQLGDLDCVDWEAFGMKP